jgi:hypothetical protein
MSSTALKMKQQGGFEQRMAKGPDGEAPKPNSFFVPSGILRAQRDPAEAPAPPGLNGHPNSASPGRR